MVTLDHEQVFLFHLIYLTDKNKEDIEREIKKAKKFIRSGSLTLPVVDFHIVNSVLEGGRSSKYGKDFNISYGLISNGSGGYDIFTPLVTNGAEDSKYFQERSPIKLSDYNKFVGDPCRIERVSALSPGTYISPCSPPHTHLLAFYSLSISAYNNPGAYYDSGFALHYLYNELNSNRRYKEVTEDGVTYYRVVRFAKESGDKLLYLAEIYEHTPDEQLTSTSRNLWFRRVDEKDIVFIDETEMKKKL